MINRAAFILKYKAPAMQWINDVGTESEHKTLSLAQINSDRTVYLIADDIADDPEKLEQWVQINLQVLFESELDEWVSDSTLWPSPLDHELFQQWFEPECHTMLVDTLEEPIEEDGL